MTARPSARATEAGATGRAPFRAGFLQFAPRFGEVEGNCRRVLRALEGVAADLVVLPELAFTGYHFADRRELLALAEDPADSPTVQALTDWCRRHRCHLVTGFAERAGRVVYNSALLIGPRGLLHTYRKLHLFNEEKRLFAAGDIPLSVQKVRGVKLGLIVCFDWAFPEVVRELALQGAEVICQPANLVLPGFCQQAMVTRCIENRVFAITANRHGRDTRPHGELHFTGLSQVVAPGGVLLARAPRSATRLSVVELDPRQARDKGITPRNDLFRDRRPDCYPHLLAARGGIRSRG
jgi:predicted amidohydrolase